MKKISISLAAFWVFFWALPSHGQGVNARYLLDGSNVLWFVQITDAHIDNIMADYEEKHLEWVFGEAMEIVNPYFLVVTGDLTDSTSEKLPYYGTGPHEREWQLYRSFVDKYGMTTDFYYDLPGNHDTYNDGQLKMYLQYSLQGSAKNATQFSWRFDLPLQSYHFFSGADPANDGKQWPADNAEFTREELNEIKTFLEANQDAEFQMAFVHHPLEEVKGNEEFKSLMGHFGAYYYACGHKHDYVAAVDENEIVGVRINSLGQTKTENLAIWAIDNNAVTVQVYSAFERQPLIIITAPADAFMGPGNTVQNPHIPVVSNRCANNPVRALIFDNGIIHAAGFQINDGEWVELTRRQDNPYQWRGYFDATSFAPGKYQVTVHATGSNPVSVSNQFIVADIPCALGKEDADDPPIADDDDDDTVEDAGIQDDDDDIVEDVGNEDTGEEEDGGQDSGDETEDGSIQDVGDDDNSDSDSGSEEPPEIEEDSGSPDETKDAEEEEPEGDDEGEGEPKEEKDSGSTIKDKGDLTDDKKEEGCSCRVR